MTDSAVCVDASLALKLVLYEPDSRLARALWGSWRAQETIVIAPTLWAYEVTSAIRHCAYRGLLSPDLEGEAVEIVHQLPVQMLNPAGLHHRAWELARRFGRSTANEAHYLALAEMAQCPLWTGDRGLVGVVHGELDWVHWLGEYRP